MKKYLLSTAIALIAVCHPTGIAATTVMPGQEESITMTSTQGGIDISSTEEKTTRFYIFSITGQLVKTIEISSGTTRIELKSGCYIVKCEQWSKKVLVK